MKKRCLILALILVFSLSVFSLSVSAKMPNVVDNADLLTANEESMLEDKIATVRDEYQFEIVVVTIETLGGKTTQQYADDFYDNNGYGVDSRHSGALLLIDMGSSSWYVSTTGYGMDAIDQNGFYYIEGEILPYLSEGEYYDSFSRFTEVCDELLYFESIGEDIPEHYYKDTMAVHEDSGELSVPKMLLIALVVGFIIAFIAVSVMKGKLKTVAYKYTASDYVKPGSLNVTHSSELFLYRHVSRTPRQQQKSSSGGGSHVSSSGRSHGGGGGRF